MEKLFLDIPQFKESRLPSLYSDFSHLKEINPEGFAANQDAWKALLLAALKKHTFHSSITLPGTQLAHKLLHPVYGEPKLLSFVLDQQIKSGDVVPWSIYKSHEVKPFQQATNYFNPKKVASAFWSNLKLNLYSLNVNGKVALDHFIVWNELVSVAEDIYAKLIQKVNVDHRISAKLFNEHLFQDTVRSLNSNLSDVDILVLLVYYSRDPTRIAIAKDPLEPTTTYVKLGSSEKISEDEIGVIKLLANLRNVQKQIDGLELKVSKDIPETLRHLKESNASEDRLRNVLIRKSASKKSLTKAYNVYSQLTQILDKIDEAKSNIELFETLKGAHSAFSLLNKQISLAEIDELNADLDDEIALTNEVSDALLVSAGIDEDEISKELEDLEKETKSQENELEKMSSEDKLMEQLQNLKIELKNELPSSKLGTNEEEDSPKLQRKVAESA